MKLAQIQFITMNSSQALLDNDQLHDSYDIWFRARVEWARSEATDQTQQKYMPDEWQVIRAAKLSERNA
jgi:hypothetical protein